MVQLMRDVREHNDIYRGTALEIKEPVKYFEKRYKEAKMELEGRALKALPEEQRRELEQEI